MPIVVNQNVSQVAAQVATPTPVVLKAGQSQRAAPRG